MEKVREREEMGILYKVMKISWPLFHNISVFLQNCLNFLRVLLPSLLCTKTSSLNGEKYWSCSFNTGF